LSESQQLLHVGRIAAQTQGLAAGIVEVMAMGFKAAPMVHKELNYRTCQGCRN